MLSSCCVDCKNEGIKHRQHTTSVYHILYYGKLFWPNLVICRPMLLCESIFIYLFSPSSHLYDMGHVSHNVHQITILKTLNFNYTISNSSTDTYHSSIVDKEQCIETNCTNKKPHVAPIRSKYFLGRTYAGIHNMLFCFSILMFF